MSFKNKGALKKTKKIYISRLDFFEDLCYNINREKKSL